MKAVVVNPEGTGVEIVANKEMRPLETGGSSCSNRILWCLPHGLARCSRRLR